MRAPHVTRARRPSQTGARPRATGAASGHAAENAYDDAELNAAFELYLAEGPETALPEFERLHDTFEASGEKENAARAERFVGESHWRLGNYETSREHLESAMAQLRSLGMRLDEGKVLNVLGLLEWDLGHYAQAMDFFAQAGAIGRELGENYQIFF